MSHEQRTQVNSADPNTICLKCGSALYHLFGVRSSEATGIVAKAAELTRPLVARVTRDDDPIVIEFDAFRVVDKPVQSNQIQRECRTCGFTWQEEINRTCGGSEYP